MFRNYGRRATRVSAARIGSDVITESRKHRRRSHPPTPLIVPLPPQLNLPTVSWILSIAARIPVDDIDEDACFAKVSLTPRPNARLPASRDICLKRALLPVVVGHRIEGRRSMVLLGIPLGRDHFDQRLSVRMCDSKHSLRFSDFPNNFIAQAN